ncbi:MAG TPA: DUF4097 family beta strand repeat-containing protein [Vicinamibacteria bacterium]
MRHVILAGLTTLAVAGAGCDQGFDHGPRTRKSLSETRPLDLDGTFRLENTNGLVEVHTWSQPQVKIEAEKAGSRWMVENTRIEIRGQGDRVAVETRQPKGPWFFGSSGRVDYHVTVPEGVRLEIETTNGRVRIEGASGLVRAATTNGGVEVQDAAGVVEASTTNGGVQVAFRSSPTGGSSRISTTNGSVTLELPADASGAFEASTVNGGIRTDFPLEISGGFGGRRLQGRLGEGKARFELRTVNGGVRIVRQGGIG